MFGQSLFALRSVSTYSKGCEQSRAVGFGDGVRVSVQALTLRRWKFEVDCLRHCNYTPGDGQVNLRSLPVSGAHEVATFFSNDLSPLFYPTSAVCAPPNDDEHMHQLAPNQTSSKLLVSFRATHHLPLPFVSVRWSGAGGYLVLGSICLLVDALTS